MLKSLALLIFILINIFVHSQEVANRFFYELSYKPDKDSIKVVKDLMVLDVSSTKSIYRDYTIISQDSLVKAIKAKAANSGEMIDQKKLFKMPNFTYKIVKNYPNLTEIEYTDRILQNDFTYKEIPNLKWDIKKEKMKIGDYNAQKATTKYGGRIWTAWFSSEIPINDGPYKFSGLPGLIVKLQDSTADYIWTLVGNKKIFNYNEKTIIEESNKIPVKVDKSKMKQMIIDYKNDPLGSIRSKLTADDLNRKMPNGNTLQENLNTQGKELKVILNYVNNPIEIQ